MLVDETKEVETLKNNHIFMTNQCYSELARTMAFETGIHKKQYTDLARKMKRNLFEGQALFEDFETKY